jgi:hypothetical protein
VLQHGPLRHRLPHRNPFAIVGWPFAVAMRGGRGPKRGPCAVIGCKDPESPAGQWNWLPPEEDLAGLEVELQPGAVCFCQKVDCRAAMGKGTRKRKLTSKVLSLVLRVRLYVVCVLFSAMPLWLFNKDVDAMCAGGMAGGVEQSERTSHLLRHV